MMVPQKPSLKIAEFTTPSVFDILNSIGTHLVDVDDVYAELSDYMLIQSGKGSLHTLMVSNHVMGMKTLDVYEKYLYTYSAYKTYKLKPTRWVSSKKKKKPEDLLYLIAIHYECSIAVAETYLTIMSEEDLKSIERYYKFAKVGKNNRLESSNRRGR